ncbi:hypothetical protein [Agromyces sp. NBRC 114283]|uniref:hypothetical protein n=1 Tax=Agromyces sp. NBRC 114283 TaxID=2994521 RepID=UPI0024A115C1|nr:hypothetical protein [Agromyces sp. NBRC 114283]GLU89701.1 hypothetical protein Agsp01_19560 [Agromyces sp. NBRC 114283]
MTSSGGAQGSTLVLTQFTLKPGRTASAYREFSLGWLRAEMTGFPSVVRFLDFDVLGYLPAAAEWELVELIEVSSVEAFRRDNESATGAAAAAAWGEWVERSSVVFLHDLAAERPAEGAG